jgi:hypothetical protein
MQASSVCILAGLWPVRTVICFSCSCKDAAEVCEEQVAGSTVLSLVEDAVADAINKLAAAEAAHTYCSARSTAAVAAAQCLQQQVAWVVKQAGLNILQGRYVAALMRTPVTLELAKALVGCGARFTFAQLLAAVASMAATGTRYSLHGPQVWMQAYKHHGLARPSDMPAVAEALCCGDELTEDRLVSCRGSIAAQRGMGMDAAHCSQAFSMIMLNTGGM